MSTTSRPARLVWMNGAPLPPEGPHLSAFDRGFTLADGVFETMRAYGGRVFRLEQHLARLARGADALAIAPLSLDDVRSWVGEALRVASAAGLADAALRLTLTRGVGSVGVAPPADAVPPTVVLTVQPVPQFPPAVFAAGLSAHVVCGATRHGATLTAGLKTLGYTESVLALAQARRRGADEAIFLDLVGHCSEATSSNLFAWSGTELITPPLTCCGALPGITRAAVIELARDLQLAVAERPFGQLELVGASEAFLTSSLRELAPLVRVDGRPIGDGTPGPVTRELTLAYAALVRRECQLGDETGRGAEEGHE